MRKGKNILIMGLFILGLGFISRMGLLLGSDNVTIYLGIRTFNSLLQLSMGIMGLGGVSTLIGLGITVTSVLKEYRQEVIVDMTPEKPALGVSGRLDPKGVRRQFEIEASKWAKTDVFKAWFTEIYVQFDIMDNQQARLHTLLTNNGAIALEDTEDILDDVEQKICKRTRNMINILSVLDVDNRETYSTVENEVKKCYEENKVLLDSAQDFMLAIAKFLNTQNNDNSIDELNMYKNVLLEEIKKSEQEEPKLE